MTVKHLTSDYIDTIALGLNEDVYGADDLDELRIQERVIDNIHQVTDYAYVKSGLVPVGVVAHLLRSLWEYEDRKASELMVNLIKMEVVP